MQSWGDRTPVFFFLFFVMRLQFSLHVLKDGRQAKCRLSHVFVAVDATATSGVDSRRNINLLHIV